MKTQNNWAVLLASLEPHWPHCLVRHPKHSNTMAALDGKMIASNNYRTYVCQYIWNTKISIISDAFAYISMLKLEYATLKYVLFLK